MWLFSMLSVKVQIFKVSLQWIVGRDNRIFDRKKIVLLIGKKVEALVSLK